MNDIINIQKIQSWPDDIFKFLRDNKKRFFGWECNCCENFYPRQSIYNQATNDLIELLQDYSMVGYHCTKLIPFEIDKIHTKGMTIQNKKTLLKRIDKLLEKGIINIKIANVLKERNLANDEIRRDQLWFCFFKPRLAGKKNIQDFFKYWGGEALYNSHNKNSIATSFLRQTGLPSIIKVKVPVFKLDNQYNSLIQSDIVKVFLESEGHSVEYPEIREGRVIEDIPAENILDIVEYTSLEFKRLSGCSN